MGTKRCNFIFRFGISIKFCAFWYPYWPIQRKKFSALFCEKYSPLAYTSLVLSRWIGRGRGVATFLLKCHAGTVSNLSHFLSCPFLRAHLCVVILYLWQMHSKQDAEPLNFCRFLYECTVASVGETSWKATRSEEQIAAKNTPKCPHFPDIFRYTAVSSYLETVKIVSGQKRTKSNLENHRGEGRTTE